MARHILTILLLLGAALIGLFYLRPSWEEFQVVRKNNASLEDLSAELDTLISNRDILLQKINSVSKENLTKIEKALPQNAQTADFLVFLEELSNHHALKLNISYEGASEARGKARSDQPRPSGATTVTPEKDAIKELAGSISLGGPYETIRSFLADLEKSLRITDTLSISFSSPPDQKNQFQFLLNLKSYYKSQ